MKKEENEVLYRHYLWVMKTLLYGTYYHPCYIKGKWGSLSLRYMTDKAYILNNKMGSLNLHLSILDPFHFHCPIVPQIWGCISVPNSLPPQTLNHHFVVSFSFLEFCSVLYFEIQWKQNSVLHPCCVQIRSHITNGTPGNGHIFS